MTLSHPLPLALILFAATLLSSVPLTLGYEKVNAVVLPIIKDSSTSLYTITLNTTSITSTNQYINSSDRFLIDLASGVVWSPCSGIGFVHCTAPICIEARNFFPFRCYPPPTSSHDRPIPCRCIIGSFNPIKDACFSGEEITIGISIASTNGKNPTSIVSADIVNICAPQSALIGLPGGVNGVAGFGQSNGVSLPSRLAWDLSFNNQFVLCLPSTTEASGVAFFGAKPYYLLPPYLSEITNFLTYTTLLKSPNYTDASYYLGVNKLAINGKSVPFSTCELNFDSAGRGGVKLSTTIPYTSMRSDIYKPFIEAFKAATKHIKSKPKVRPFELCFDTRALGSTRVGYAVPSVDIMFNNGKNWTIFGANSLKDMKEKKNTACFAFVDGGIKMVPAITLGGFQMEDSFLLFDVPNSTLGFIPTLRGLQTTCSNFNFTSGV
ncbi:hypothetical protein LUZ60_003605 [Juncus effusus]|nr:hypothetical protein LUZ60_003605 [Juncus effusus]